MDGEKIWVFCVDDHEATSSFYRLALSLNTGPKLTHDLSASILGRASPRM